MSRLDVQKGAGGGGRRDRRMGSSKSEGPVLPSLSPSFVPSVCRPTPNILRDPITSLFSANPQTRYPSVGGRKTGWLTLSKYATECMSEGRSFSRGTEAKRPSRGMFSRPAIRSSETRLPKEGQGKHSLSALKRISCSHHSDLSYAFG